MIKTKLLLIIISIAAVFSPGFVFALGEYDGVWAGVQTITVPGYLYESEITGTAIYQNSQTSMSLYDPLYGSVTLVKSGDTKWILPSPITATVMGYLATVNSIELTFGSSSYFTGSVAVSVQGISATSTLQHYRKSCTSISNNATITGLSGSNYDVRCYEIDIPYGASNLNVVTSGGSGNCDLTIGYHKPDFNVEFSESDTNAEQISVSVPDEGKWYIVLSAWPSYASMTLQASFDVGYFEPVSSFSMSVQTGAKPLTVQFTDQSTNTITSWAWDFGDGTTSSEQNPVHIYQTPGTYTVSLTVTGPGGTNEAVKTDYITVTGSTASVNIVPALQLLLSK